DSLLGDRLAVRDQHAEFVGVQLDRLVEVVDRDTDVIDRFEHGSAVYPATNSRHDSRECLLPSMSGLTAVSRKNWTRSDFGELRRIGDFAVAIDGSIRPIEPTRTLLVTGDGRLRFLLGGV